MVQLPANGRTWAFDVIPDKAPEIAFDGRARQRTVNGALEIGFTVKDDYGVQEAQRRDRARRNRSRGDAALRRCRNSGSTFRAATRSDGKGLTSKNLTEHPLAGKRVRITLVAKDAAGADGPQPAHEMITAVASVQRAARCAAVAEERQVFALDTRKMPEAIALNEALTIRPDETIPNLTHYLLLAVGADAHEARQRRGAARRIPPTISGRSPSASRTATFRWPNGDLRDAQQKLADALQRNASDAEIKKLMEELRKAMKDYLNELAQRMQNMPMQPNQKPEYSAPAGSAADDGPDRKPGALRQSRCRPADAVRTAAA